jgi:hypothetical protein
VLVGLEWGWCGVLSLSSHAPELCQMFQVEIPENPPGAVICKVCYNFAANHKQYLNLSMMAACHVYATFLMSSPSYYLFI